MVNALMIVKLCTKILNSGSKYKYDYDLELFLVKALP